MWNNTFSISAASGVCEIFAPSSSNVSVRTALLWSLKLIMFSKTYVTSLRRAKPEFHFVMKGCFSKHFADALYLLSLRSIFEMSVLLPVLTGLMSRTSAPPTLRWYESNHNPHAGKTMRSKRTHSTPLFFYLPSRRFALLHIHTHPLSAKKQKYSS